jgi:hypothetical protein
MAARSIGQRSSWVPSAHARVDSANPLSVELVAAVTVANRVDHVSGRGPTATLAGAIVAERYGPAGDYTSGNGYQTYQFIPPSQSDEITIALLHRPTSTTNTIGRVGVTTAAQAHIASMQHWQTPFTAADGVINDALSIVGPAFTLNKPILSTFRYRSGVIAERRDIYIDATNITTATPGVAALVGYGSAPLLVVANERTLGFAGPGTYTAAFVWGRLLSPVELHSLAAAPFQMLAPRTRRYFRIPSIVPAVTFSTVYLSTGGADAAVTVGAGTKKKATNALPGGSSTIANINTVAGSTAGVQFTDSTTAGTNGTAISWYTDALGVQTIAGQVTWSMWTKEAAVGNNAAAALKIERCSGDGTVLSTIAAITPSQAAGEMGNAAAADSGTITAGNVTDTTLANGDRLRITVWIDDAADQGGTGTMASGGNCQIWYGANTGQGLASVTFAETLTLATTGSNDAISGTAVLIAMAQSTKVASTSVIGVLDLREQSQDTKVGQTASATALDLRSIINDLKIGQQSTAAALDLRSVASDLKIGQPSARGALDLRTTASDLKVGQPSARASMDLVSLVDATHAGFSAVRALASLASRATQSKVATSVSAQAELSVRSAASTTKISSSALVAALAARVQASDLRIMSTSVWAEFVGTARALQSKIGSTSAAGALAGRSTVNDLKVGLPSVRPALNLTSLASVARAGTSSLRSVLNLTGRALDTKIAQSLIQSPLNVIARSTDAKTVQSTSIAQLELTSTVTDSKLISDASRSTLNLASRLNTVRVALPSSIANLLVHGRSPASKTVVEPVTYGGDYGGSYSGIGRDVVFSAIATASASKATTSSSIATLTLQSVAGLSLVRLARVVASLIQSGRSSDSKNGQTSAAGSLNLSMRDVSLKTVTQSTLAQLGQTAYAATAKLSSVATRAALVLGGINSEQKAIATGVTTAVAFTSRIAATATEAGASAVRGAVAFYARVTAFGTRTGSATATGHLGAVAATAKTGQATAVGAFDAKASTSSTKSGQSSVVAALSANARAIASKLAATRIQGALLGSASALASSVLIRLAYVQAYVAAGVRTLTIKSVTPTIEADIVTSATARVGKTGIAGSRATLSASTRAESFRGAVAGVVAGLALRTGITVVSTRISTVFGSLLIVTKAGLRTLRPLRLRGRARVALSMKGGVRMENQSEGAAPMLSTNGGVEEGG